MKVFVFSKRVAKEMIRDPLNLCFGIGFPLVLLFLLSAIQKNIPVDLFRIESLAPGIVVFGLSFISLFSATLISKDRESALLQRLYASPLSSVDFLLGYTIPIIPLALIQAIISFSFSFIFGLKFNTGLLLAVLFVIPLSLLYISIGILCGSVLNVKQVGGICGAALTNVSAWLSGTWFDIDLMGTTFKKIAEALPFIHAVNIERGLLSECYEGLLSDFLYVFGYTVILFVIAILLFKKQMKKA